MWDVQDSDFKWFISNMPKLYQKYGDCYLAIKNQQIIGVYSSYSDGVIETSKVEPVGTFIVQKCGSDESAYTVSIATAFAI